MLVGTDGCIMDLVVWHPDIHHLQTVTQGQVEVPLLILTGNLFHGEGSIGKRIVHLLSYLESLQGDSRSDNGLNFCRICVKGFVHNLQGMLHDTGHGASPPGMYGSTGMVLFIIEDDWDTVGSRHTNTYIFLLRNHRIYPLEELLSDRSILFEERLIDQSHLCMMCLVRDHQTIHGDSQIVTEHLSVREHIFWVITTIVINVKRFVKSFAYPSMTPRAEGCDSLIDIIKQECVLIDSHNIRNKIDYP